MAVGDPLEMKAVQWLWNTASTFFVSMFQSVWSGFIEMTDTLLKKVFDFYLVKLGKLEDTTWKGLLDPYLKSGLINQRTYDNLYSLRGIATPLDGVAFVMVMGQLASSYIQSEMAPIMSNFQQAANKDYRSGLPNYGDIIQAAFIAPEKAGEVREIMARFGLTEEQIDLVFLSNYRLYDVTAVRDLYLRGELSTDQMYQRMRELGFTDTRTQEIIKLWEVIPTAQDLFWMVGKEAFEREIIELIGLDDEFPADQVPWLQKQGISEDWAKKYWYAHWDQPSVGQGYEMLHRGVIGFEELNILFKAVEMPPYWRDKLTQIAYTPYGRIDVRRMHDMGVLKNEDLITAYKDLGYDDEKAANMALFTIKYNQQNDKELTKSVILRSYVDGLISRADCKDMLLTLDFSEDLAEYTIVFTEFQRDLDYQNDLVKNIGDRYTNNLLTESVVRAELGKLNLPATRIEILIDKWKIDKFEDMKVPSKTDMEKFYLNDIIDEDGYMKQLQKLGYSYEYADWYRQITNMKKN